MPDRTSPLSGRAGLGGVRHLGARWGSAVGGAEPDHAEEAVVLELLSPSEMELYWAMSTADRRHAVCSAMAIVAQGGEDELVVASALHDVGKAPAGLGTSWRVIASILTMILGRRRTIALAGRRGLLGRVGVYVSHPDVGSQMLTAAGSSDLACRWAAEHHSPLEESTLEPEVAARLWLADRSPG